MIVGMRSHSRVPAPLELAASLPWSFNRLLLLLLLLYLVLPLLLLLPRRPCAPALPGAPPA